MPALTALAALDASEKRPEHAAKRFELALQKEPRNVPVHMALIALRQQAGAPKAELEGRIKAAIKQSPEALAPRLALVGLHLQNKDTKLALAAAQEGAAAIQGNVEMLLALAQAQQATGDSNQAMSTASKAAALQPESPMPLLRMAELQLAQKDSNGALQTLKKALALKPDSTQVQAAFAGVAVRAGKVDEARSVLSGLQKQYPKSLGPFVIEGDLEMGEKRFAAAARAYRNALNLQEDTSLAIKWLTALQLDGKSEEAKRQGGQWASRFPKDARFVFYQGDQALAANDLALAMERYKRVLELQPDHAVAANNIAWILNKTGKPGALEYAQKANALKPDFAPFLDTLAGVLADSGKLDEALAAQQKAVSLDPSFHPHRLNLADLLLRAGKKAEAAEQLKQLAALGDKFPRQDEVKRLQAKL
jgi:putative PEP-CTERM system TPR-repeat lipoprotein